MKNYHTIADIEDIILGMADMVHENRRLRSDNSWLRLQDEKNKRFLYSLTCSNPEHAKARDILADIEDEYMRHRGQMLCEGIDAPMNWEIEYIRRMHEAGYKVELR